MNIEVRKNHVEVQKTLVENIRRHLADNLGRFNHLIRHVTVHLADVNGPRGGEDKVCRIQIHLKRATIIVVEDRGASLFAVVGRAITRVDMAMSRAIEKVRGQRRSKARKFVNHPCVA